MQQDMVHYEESELYSSQFWCTTFGYHLSKLSSPSLLDELGAAGLMTDEDISGYPKQGKIRIVWKWVPKYQKNNKLCKKFHWFFFFLKWLTILWK